MTRFAVGIGARSGVRTTAVRALLEQVLAGHGLDPSGAVFATVTARADEPGLREALGPGVEVVVWRAEELAAEPVPHPSGRVAGAVGTPSVAEAAALRTARTLSGATGAGLVVPKTVGDGVTVAVARPTIVRTKPQRGR
jgi:cobalt-precorrin 5A hydrolase